MTTIIPKTTTAVISATERKFRGELAELLAELLAEQDPSLDTALLAQARREVAEAQQPGKAFPDLRATAAEVLAELDRLGR